jgi:transposase
LAAVSAMLGVAQQTLHNWVKAEGEGKLTHAAAKPVSAEQMELARLRAEVARLKMERDILKKALSATMRCSLTSRRFMHRSKANMAGRACGKRSLRAVCE